MIINRYIVKEHVAPFFFGLALIIFIFIMNLLVQTLGRIAGKGLPLLVIIEFFALNLAWILALAVPMAVLIATLSAFGRMSGDGEITALRASGVSPNQLIRPALFASLLITAWVMWFNNFVLPEMNHRTKLLQIDISRKKPTWSIEPNIYNFEIPNYILHAKGVNQKTSTLKEVTIFDEHNPEERSTITAKEGLLQFQADQEIVLMTLFKGEIHRPSDREPDAYEYTRFDSAKFRLSIPGMVLKRGRDVGRSERELDVREMMNRINEIRDNQDVYSRRRISQYLVEIHKKFSIPAACIVFILIGAPLGILAHKGGLGVSGAVSLIFFTIYWAFLTAGEQLADRGRLSPAISMWIANVTLAACGFYLIWLTHRRTTLPGVRLVSNLISKLLTPWKEPDKKSKPD